MHTNKEPLLEETAGFLSDLADAIKHAEKRIWIQVMIFEITPAMEKYITLLSDAAKRGVDVWITADWISERYYGDDLDTLFTVNPNRMKKRQVVRKIAQDMVERLRKSGVRFVVDKIPSRVGRYILIGNRNHNKLFLIDDIFWTGGINFITAPNKFIDFMVKIFDSEIISIVEKYFISKPKNDISIRGTPEYRFLIDSGKKWSSLIYDEATALISEAEKEIVLVSQLLPDSKFLRILLKKSLEGVKVTIIISHKDHNIFTRFPFRIHLDSFLLKIKNNPNIEIIHAGKKIHAKLLLVDNEKAIFGSHNFASWNELIGIEETGFLTSDTRLITQFIEFIDKTK